MILWLPRWFRQDGRLSQERVATDLADIALGGLIQRRPAAKGRRPARIAKTFTTKATKTTK
jgi:hypothetical protein